MVVAVTEDSVNVPSKVASPMSTVTTFCAAKGWPEGTVRVTTLEVSDLAPTSTGPLLANVTVPALDNAVEATLGCEV